MVPAGVWVKVVSGGGAGRRCVWLAGPCAAGVSAVPPAVSTAELSGETKHTSQYVCTQEFCSEVLIATNHFSGNQITRCCVCPDQIAIHTRTMYGMYL